MNYIKAIIDLKYEKDNSPLKLKSFDCGFIDNIFDCDTLFDYDFDGETLSKENGQYFCTNSNGEKCKLDDITQFYDIHSLALIVYYQTI